jgi:hypothetical protein
MIWLKQRWEALRLAVIESHPIARVPWSAIRRIGQSRLLALTIIVPFLGSLIVFNKHVVDVLTISPELADRFLHKPDVAPSDTARALTLSKLYFVYFGLSFLGFASAVFALVCPLEIKSFDSSRSYLEAERPLASKSRMGLIIPNIAKHYLLWSDDDDYFFRRAEITRRLGDPAEYTALFVHVIITVWDKMTTKEYLGPVTAEDFESGEHDLLDHRGQPKIDEIARLLRDVPTVFRGVAYMVQEVAATEEMRNDVLTLQYLALDHSKPWWRVLVTFLYSIGFLLLLIPTAMTFCRVVVSLI